MSRFSRLARRGATMVEVMVAAAVLAIGLTAIAAVLTQSVLSSRNSLRKGEATLTGASTLDAWACRGFANLSEGAFDAGTVFNELGVPLYTQVMRIRSLADAGVPGLQLELEVQYIDSRVDSTMGQSQSQRYTTVVSGGFVDGG